MQHYWSLESIQLKDAWITIGSFDGVHLGHQAIIQKVVTGAHALGAPAVVLTFDPHPAVVLGKRPEPYYLTTPEERADLLGGLGIDVVITHAFNQDVAAITARSFISRLKSHLGLRHLCVGHDFALGRNREGDVTFLSKLGEEFGYQVDVVPPFKIDGKVVSSSRIRACLVEGDVEQALHLLGRPYQINGEVISGDGRGKTIGIPTANLSIWSKRALPDAGVYVCNAHVNGIVWGAVTNIGVRPTFEDQSVSQRVETHILDFDEDIYGQGVLLDFLSYIRAERRFDGVEALVEQIQRDISQARKKLSS